MADEAGDALPQVELFTDGACQGNPGPGGYGVVLKFARHRKELSGSFEETTNNRMELMAAIVGLRALNRRCRVNLTTDSEYLADSISKGWAQRWRENGWWRSANKRVANHDLWSILLDLLTQHEVTLVWTRGHNGNRENERCDQLASYAIRSTARAIDDGYQKSKTTGPKSIPEGHPCFQCRTPVVKRTPKTRKAGKAYHYDWYLYCPNCQSMYMVEEGRRVNPGANARLPFDASQQETESSVAPTEDYLV